MNSKPDLTGGAFHPSGKLSINETETDGWLVRLGKTSPLGLYLELWFDRYPATRTRRFYYGFYAINPLAMQGLKKQLPQRLRPVRTLSRNNYSESRPRAWILCEPLKRAEFNKPIYEHYSFGRTRNYYFYGEYVPAERPTGDNLRRTVEQAADFFSEVMWLLPKRSMAETKTKIYPQLERSVVRKHLVRERNPQLAKACKRRDGYRCQVCKMTFAEVYGDALGAEFAEAHHLHPLSKKGANEKTWIEDLVTVCSNCHRMLHLMRGREHDLEELKKVMQVQKRNKS
jgi:hypothetical protein